MSMSMDEARDIVRMMRRFGGGWGEELCAHCGRTIIVPNNAECEPPAVYNAADELVCDPEYSPCEGPDGDDGVREDWK